jgi:TolB-like protein
MAAKRASSRVHEQDPKRVAGPRGDAETLAATTPSEPRPVLGKRYELEALLGSGGMGNVYRARDIELDEVVALKVLRPEIASKEGIIERFRREVKLARRVTHPNVARVFDIGEHGGDRILTMELVEGEPLSALLARGRVPLARAVEIGRAICAGVAAAHGAGVVHRDLKPDNVMIAKDGRVVVTDFGIARAAADSARTVGFVGTPAYMAPEQIDERVVVDHRADVYAFGALLYELMTGERAWQGESLWALAAARLTEPPPDPRAKRPDLPAAVAEVVLRCMQRAPGDRYPSMDDVSTALAGVVVTSASVSSVVTPAPIPSASTASGEKRVAVLPFANLGPPDQEYVADGLTEDLIDALSVARGLRVRSRGMVMRFKGTSGDARDVGRDLDVQVVIEGSVRRTPSGFRVNARLVSVADGFQLWARKFDVAENELLAQNDVIAHAIADALTVDLEGAVRAPAADAEALDLYLRARHASHLAFTDPTASLKLFEAALGRSPNDPRVLAGRAMAGSMQWMWPPDERDKCFASAERSLVLAPLLPEAHVAVAGCRCNDGNTVGTIAPARRALRLAPGNAEAHDLLGRCLVDAFSDAAEGHSRAALAAEPSFEFPWISLARHYAFRGAWADVEHALDRASPAVRMRVWARFALWQRDSARARAILAEMGPTRGPTADLARSWLELVAYGKPSEGMPKELAAAPLSAFLRFFFNEMHAEIAAYSGRTEVVLATMQKLDAQGHTNLGWIEHCPLFEDFRALPEAAVIRRNHATRAAAIVAEYERPLD